MATQRGEMMFKKLLLVLGLLGIVGCGTGADLNDVRLQPELANKLANKQQEASSLTEAINSVSIQLREVPNIKTFLSKRELDLVLRSKLVQQIEKGAFSGCEIEKSEIQTSVNQMVDIAIGRNATSEEQIADLKVSIASGLSLFQQRLSHFFHWQRISLLAERKRLVQRREELTKEIVELVNAIEAMEKT